MMQTRAWLACLVSAFLVRLAHGQSPSPSAGDVVSEVIEQAAKDTSKAEKPQSQSSPAASAAETADDEYWCQKLLKGSITKYLPEGYSNAQTSLIEMTPAEQAGGMHCKISVQLQGPASFNAIRYRIYKNETAADRGFDSLWKQLPPDIVVIADNLGFQHDLASRYQVPCVAFTAGKRDQTFVSCADQLADTVISGVSSQRYAGNSIDSETTRRAGILLEAGIAALRGQAGETIDGVWKDVFGKDHKK